MPAAGGRYAVAILLGNVQQLGFGQIVARVHSQPPAERLPHAAAAEPEFARLAEHAQFQQVFRRGQWDTVGSAARRKAVRVKRRPAAIYRVFLYQRCQLGFRRMAAILHPWFVIAHFSTSVKAWSRSSFCNGYPFSVRAVIVARPRPTLFSPPTVR